MSAALSKIRAAAVNASAAGRYMAMLTKHVRPLTNIRNVLRYAVHLPQRATVLSVWQYHADMSIKH